ncbi:MAG: hypothetical protein AUG51_11615 [Acidobacteria bacterium 13_1_20CM_3_53_8]|nr:MAG: hypothetical protein AUG51_11615 [Acidobacteria bacterium 13_1_20CM_3_53_8]
MIAVNSHAVANPLEARKFDGFGDICCEDEEARLDGFAMELQSNPGASGYIIFYGGRRHNYPYCDSHRLLLPRRGEAEARASRMKPYLVDRRGINPDRIVMINGGYRELWEAELWIAPKGANPPTPTPTVRPEEIRFRKGRIRKRRYMCDEE